MLVWSRCIQVPEEPLGGYHFGKVLSKLEADKKKNSGAASLNQGSGAKGESTCAWVAGCGCHGSSYGNADASAGPVPTGAQLVSWKMRCPREWAGPCLIEIIDK